MNLKAAHVALGPHPTIEGLTVGVRLPLPELRVVRQPHHAQFVVSAVPDDIAAAFDCETRLSRTSTKRVARAYGNYFGATFNVNGRTDTPVALLWGKEDGYWKIGSWKVGTDAGGTPASEPVPEMTVERISVDAGLQQAVRGFLESWLVRKDYDAAFAFARPDVPSFVTDRLTPPGRGEKIARAER